MRVCVCVMCSLVLRDGDGVVRVIVVPSNLWRQTYSKCNGDKYSSMYGRHKVQHICHVLVSPEVYLQ